MKNLITRAVTGIIFVGIIVLSFFISPAFFHIIFLTFALISTWEFLQLAEKQGSEPQYMVPFLLTATILSAFQLMMYSLPLFIILILLSVLLIFTIPVVELFRKTEKPAVNISVSLFPTFWIALPFSIAGMWTHFFEAGNIVLALFIIIWLYDTLAYCAGSLFGKRPLFERISPKKSWEGFLISLVLTIMCTMIFVRIPYFQNIVFPTIFHWMGFAFVIIISGTLGDLVESLFKRSSKVKDSGNILPGHGGILDRFDSFLFAAPAGFIYWLLFYIF